MANKALLDNAFMELKPWQIRAWRLLVAGLIFLMLPIPWKYDMSNTLGIALRLDSRLYIEGREVSPPGDGQFYWLTSIGRPQLVVEALHERAFESSGRPAVDVLSGPLEHRPKINEPAAVAVGLSHAGQNPPQDLSGGVNFGKLFRNFSSGGSHGLMIALVAYSEAADENLSQGRHIAGTGGVTSNGTVSIIGSLEQKAQAAQRADVDVLLVPEAQAHRLNDMDLSGMQVVAVATLQEAIEWLSVPISEQ